MILKLVGLSMLCAFLTSGAHAITLQWLDGGTNINFASATRCTLLVSITEPDTALPTELRLSWVARNCPEVHVVPEGSTDPSGVESRVNEIIDQTELERGARFQNVRAAASGPHSTVVRFVIDLPAGAQGNIRAEAADLDGGTNVSNSVTFNSGIGVSFAPVVFKSRTVIENNAVVVHARGIGLGASRGVRLVTADTTWSAPFDLVQRDDTSLTARNTSLNTLPGAMIQLTTAEGDGSAIAGSSVTTPAAPADFVGYVILKDPNPTVTPKDFALVYDVSRNLATGRWEGLYHVYYIRQTGSGDAAVGRVLAHNWSHDLVDWQIFPDTTEFVAGAGGGAWDASQVWAPSLIKRGGLWYMFYTGVDAASNQSIGYATKESLTPDGTSWQRRTTAVLTKVDVPYVDPASPVQLRDPFVIEDPDLAGRLLMMYTAKNDPLQTGLPPGYTIGLSRNDVDLDNWISLGRYVDTDVAHSSDAQVESPQAFRDPNVSTEWRLMWTAAFKACQYSIDFDQVVRPASLSSTSQGSWGNLQHLYIYTDGIVGYCWAGTEFLHTGEYLQPPSQPLAAPFGYTDFLAGYLQAGVRGIQISKLTWGSVDTAAVPHQDFSLDLFLTAVGDLDTGPKSHPSVRARAAIIRSAGVCATVFTARPEPVVVELLDVTGRVVRELLHQKVPIGATPVFWDLRDAAGTAVRPGMFFVRLRSPGGEGVARFAVLR